MGNIDQSHRVSGQNLQRSPTKFNYPSSFLRFFSQGSKSIVCSHPSINTFFLICNESTRRISSDQQCSVLAFSGDSTKKKGIKAFNLAQRSDFNVDLLNITAYELLKPISRNVWNELTIISSQIIIFFSFPILLYTQE